jgi:flagellar FliL protein
MSKKKGDDAPKGGPKKFAVPVVALLLGAFVGPKFLGGGSGAAEAGAATTTTTAPGTVVSLEPITLNLTDGHLLKVGLALQISAEWEAEHAEGGEEGHAAADATSTDPTQGYARALDTAITVFGRNTMADLMDQARREAARTELTVLLEEAFHGEIEGVYLYEFVMQ